MERTLKGSKEIYYWLTSQSCSKAVLPLIRGLKRIFDSTAGGQYTFSGLKIRPRARVVNEAGAALLFGQGNLSDTTIPVVSGISGGPCEIRCVDDPDNQHGCTVNLARLTLLHQKQLCLGLVRGSCLHVSCAGVEHRSFSHRGAAVYV